MISRLEITVGSEVGISAKQVQSEAGPTLSAWATFLFLGRLHSADIKKPAENFSHYLHFTTITTTAFTAARLVLLQHHAVSLTRPARPSSIALEE